LIGLNISYLIEKIKMTFTFLNQLKRFAQKKEKKQSNANLKIGLVLSGGGARGIAHLGVLQAFKELDITPHLISGVSAGALAGAFYCAGYKPLEVLEFFKKVRINRFFRPLIGRRGLLKLDKAGFLLHQYLEDDFASLKIPLVVTATDLQNSELVYFSQGKIIKPLLASCSIPILFEPVEIEGKLFVDGGILNNLPIEPLQAQCDIIIGSHVNPFKIFREIKGIRSVIEQSFHLAISHNVAPRRAKCDILIEPTELKNYSINKISKAEEIFKIGYNTAYPLLKEFVEKQKTDSI
jgi:NTE family protein